MFPGFSAFKLSMYIQETFKSLTIKIKPWACYLTFEAALPLEQAQDKETCRRTAVILMGMQIL
jgi:hypothetical protein